ncbi:hypothetical protein ATKI12_5251 [Kitasatospora sp. Ki12]
MGVLDRGRQWLVAHRWPCSGDGRAGRPRSGARTLTWRHARVNGWCGRCIGLANSVKRVVRLCVKLGFS